MSENNLKEVWHFAMDQLKKEYTSQGEEKEKEFTLWFNMNYVDDTIDTIKVSVPNQFMWNSMKSKGNVDKIIEKIKEISGLPRIEIIPEIKDEQIFSEKSDTKEDTIEISAKKDDKKINSEHIEQKKSKHTILNEDFTFDNFITGEGSSSNFAYKVALSVADNPGTKTNPVLFYGGVGLGKTHLMQAIGNKIYEKHGNSKKICYIQAESFTKEFTDSIISKTPNEFKNKYRKLDVLLIDDIQFLTGKEGSQQELFYVFEALYQNKAQMVFTCDRPLREIEQMEKRLVSRLGSGMSLDLQPPNFETRKAIIYKKLEKKEISLSDEVVDMIAKSIETNIRDLEAALNEIIGLHDFMGKEITVESVQQRLQNFYNSPSVGNISIKNIMEVVADNYQITVADLKGKKRDKKFVIPRHIALYIAKEITEYTFSELGNEFGGRDHSSIMHACDKIKEQIKTNPIFNQKINTLIKEIKEYKK